MGHRLVKRAAPKKRVMITLPARVFWEFRDFAIVRGLSQARAGEVIITRYMKKEVKEFQGGMVNQQEQGGKE